MCRSALPGKETSFNSSLVRLGEWLEEAKQQGYDVSIPAWCDWENVPVNSFLVLVQRFNSSLVRLGVGTSVITASLRGQFQFQLGAIGRIDYGNPEQVNVKFQFQLGAIGRIKSWHYSSSSGCFNSSLVRLGDR